ncbi:MULTISPECIES: hypothetical protein [Nesterenkonia]|uniref:Uncharacterized protein n=1 Tax=Nesterenkonia jeotgali TaxID=317018 RepID=A0A839FZE4_9MICC|nr:MULTISPECIES: hypothetical protein [Nesterenkonia]MBA8922087.1 hypothetical protein [Nesterenkonia jeotgali]
MEITQFHPELKSIPTAVNSPWKVLRMKETAQVKGHMIVSKKPMYLSDVVARRHMQAACRLGGVDGISHRRRGVSVGGLSL